MKNNVNKILVLFFVTLAIGFSQDNYSLSFDGAGDYIELAPSSNLAASNNELTVESWIKVSSSNNNAHSSVFGARLGYGYVLYAGSNDINVPGAANFVIFTSDNSWNELQGNIDLRDDQWHHVAATYDGTVAKLYIDGELDNEIYFNTDYLSTLDGGNYSTNIGTANHASEYFNGIIDDLAIWNRALTEQQIQAQMNAPLLGNELGLAAYWNFNEGQGNSLTDLSGNGNDGAINGATWTDDVPSLENDSDYDENYSVHFDFMSGYSESLTSATNIFGGIQPFTVEAWYKNEGVNTGANSGYDDGANIVSSYRRSGGGDPYGNFNFGIHPGDSENSGKGYADHGVKTNERMDDGAWHHLAATYEPNADGSWSFRLYLDGVLNDQNTGPSEGYDHTSSNNNIRMNNHSPFAGDHMLDCSYAGMSITNGAKYTENFSPQFPLSSDGNTIVNLDFSEGGGNQLIDNSGNGNHFNLYGNYQWESDVPTEPVYGCTDEYADNYNSEATSDDGSCSGYPDNGDYALSFNGDGDYVSVQSEELDELFSGYNPFTVSLWVYGNSGGNNNTYGELFDKGNTPNNVGQNPKSVMLLKQSDGAVTLLLYSGNTDFIYAHASNDILDPQSWNHITAVYDGGTESNSLNLYKNGTLFENVIHSGNGTFTGIRNSENQPFHFGSRVMDNGNTHISFSGKMDESTIWDRALSDQEVLSNMYSDTSGYQPGLVSQYKFDANSGSTLFDHSGNSNHGVISGATWDDETFSFGCTDVYADNFDPNANAEDGSCSGYPDNGEYSLSFDNDNVSIGEIGDYSSKVTIMAWVKKDGTDSYSNIVSGGCGNLFLTEHNNKILFGSQCSNPIAHDTYGSTDITDNIWHHVAATYDADAGQNNLKVYVDGVLDGQSTKTASFSVNSFRIGSNNNGNGEQYNGNIDMLRIWNTALTQEQIQENMNSSVASVETDLLADWRFNVGDGDILYDHSGNGNHGSINGASWETDVPELPILPVPGGNNSLRFDGADDYVDTGIPYTAFSGATSLIFEFTFRQSAGHDDGQHQGLITSQSSGNTQIGIRLSDQNYLEFGFKDDNSGFSTAYLDSEVILPDQWYSVKIVLENNQVQWYLNNQLIETDDVTFQSLGQESNNVPTLSFGRGNTVYGEYFDGLFDDVKILINNESDYFAHWDFNEGEGNTLPDISGNGNNGTINGATWSGEVPVFGCADPYSENYNADANLDDGSCEYSQEAVTFTKQNYADPSMAENQDRITGNVWITRGTSQPLYNAALESGYQDQSISPEGTVWASGQTAFHVSTDNYRAFKQATGGNHQYLPGRVMSMHIVGTGLFYDVEFHSWTSDGNGGGFSYTRTPAELNSYDYPEGTVHFHKEDYADWELIQNQDRITEDTWITRANSNGIFNASSEDSYNFSYDDQQEIGPSNTLWAYGVTGDVQGEYRPFKEAVQDQMGMSGLDEGGHTFSMYIVSENLFYDVEFHSWTCCGDGGGFSYTRTDQNGESVTFTKEDYANYTLEENQDRITDGVWITRGNDHPLFNIAAEANYEAATLYTNAVGSPENTEWAFGRTEDLNPNSYQPWQAAIGGTNPRGSLGRFMSLHVISEDLYFDVVFTSWTCCANGGGFSYSRMPASQDSGPVLNGKLVGVIESELDNLPLEGAHIIAVAEDESYSGEAFSDENGGYSIDLIGSLNYFVTISYEGLIDHNQYIYVAPFEDTYINVSLGGLEDAMVEGTVTDWYSNVPLANASVLLAYTDEEMTTIESTTDENGYFMVQVPGEEDYDLFVYADGYWVEHDAFYLSSGEHQVLSVGIAEMSAASRLYGTIRDFDSDELIPYAEVQLNCEQASDWDHTGEIGTYRVFSYYPDDCDDGVLIVAADGYETSVQSVGSIEFDAGSSYDLDIALVQGNDPDPGMLSGTVYSNIDGNVVGGANVTAYNVNTTQLFSVETLDDGSYQLFLPESEYYISVTADNHEEYLDTLSITSGQSFTLDFSLDEMYLNTVSGVITDLSGNGLFDMEVYVIPAGESYSINSTFSNENGEYSLQVPNGLYDFGAGSNGYFMNFEYGVELSGSNQVIDFTLTPVSEFDGGIAGIVHLNDGDNSTVRINVWNSSLTYQAYISPDENGAYALPLVNGEYTMYAWVPGSDYEPVFIPSAFTIEDNVINYDIYFVAPDSPEAPTIVFLEDVPNDQGGQLELAWTPGEPREYEIFPQYSIWRMEDDWNLIATVPYHGFDLYNMIVPTQGDSTADGIFESTFMVTAHTLDQNTFFDSDPLTGYSVDNIFPGIPQQLVATFQDGSVDLEWNISEAEDLSHYNVYRQNQSLVESALVFVSENNFYSDHVGIDGDFQYWVTAVDLSGNESDASELAMVTLGIVEEVLPLEFALLQNYPNPFNPSTQIMYTLPKTSSVKIVIYDMLGLKVRTLFSGSQDAGYKNVLWNATNDQGDPVSAGMYIYTIEAASFFSSKKMILLK